MLLGPQLRHKFDIKSTLEDNAFIYALIDVSLTKDFLIGLVRQPHRKA